MKTIIAIIMTIMFGFNTAAKAEIGVATPSYENVHKYAVKFIPDVTDDEVKACYNAVKNGPEYQIKRRKIKIECADGEMVVFRRLF